MIEVSLGEIVGAIGMEPVASHPSVLQWRPFPKSPCVYYLTEAAGRFLAWHAPPDVPADQVAQFLSGVAAEHLDAVSEGRPAAVFSLPGPVFADMRCMAVVHPSVAQYAINRATQAMRPQTWLAFPCHRCEFTDDDSPSEASCRIREGTLGFSKPLRDPSPALAMRYEHLRPKRTGSSGGKKLGIFVWADVHKHVMMLPEHGGFVELENWERRRVIITHQDGHWQVTEGGDTWEPLQDEVEPWLRALAFESHESAAT